MLVFRKDIDQIVKGLAKVKLIGLDTETTGLRPYHGDRPFSLILSNGWESYYFNTQAYEGANPETVLDGCDLVTLDLLFRDPEKIWAMHHAKFDLAQLLNWGFEIKGTIHCTKSIARIEYNEHLGYSLAECAERIGEKKDEAVERYIDEHKLWSWENIPGKKMRKKNKDFTKVPLNVMVTYGEKDGFLPYQLCVKQTESIKKESDSLAPGLPTLRDVASNERRLTKTVHRMERVGVKIDPDYCLRASRYEADRAEKALDEFRCLTGKPFKASPLLFQDVFSSDKELWEYTEKKNPSFESDVLKKFKNPAAQWVLNYRDAKSKSDFHLGFLYHMDKDGVVHPSWNQDDTRSGRFASSNPNFQNLTTEDALRCKSCGKGSEVIVTQCPKCGSTQMEEVPYLIRRAIVPRPGFVLFLPDYTQMEYKMALDYACQLVGYLTPLAKRVNDGEDVHEVVNQLVKEHSGIDIGRSHAKNVNFAKLYGAWITKLSKMIGCSFEEAKKIWDAVAAVAPEFDVLTEQCKKTAAERGYIRNWLGRRSYFPNSNDSYKAPNYLIQGSCADVNKVGLNEIDQYLQSWRSKSRLIGTIHDENIFELHTSELQTAEHLSLIMANAYPHKYVPMTVSAEWSDKSLADKKKGYPV